MPRVPLTEDQAWLQGKRSKAQPQTESPHTGGRPKLPKHLTPVAKEKWKELIKVLSKRGTLTKADGTLIELACETYALWRLYVADVHTRGAYVDGEPNPSTKHCTAMENTLARYMVQLGITPASREKAKQTAPAPPKKPELIPNSEAWLLQQREIERAAALETEDEYESDERETESEEIPNGLADI